MRTVQLRVGSVALVAFLLLSALTPLDGMLDQTPSEVPVELSEAGQRLLADSARGSSNQFLTGGGSSSGSEYIQSIGFSPGMYGFGGSFNTSMNFGSTSLSPTSPAGSEFFIGAISETGSWQFLLGADHSAGISIFSDIAVGMGGEIAVIGYYTGTIQFGGLAISSQSIDGFVAKADQSGQWMWAHTYQTMVNNSQENSQPDTVAFDPMGDVVVSGTFQGETDFGGTSFNVSDTEIFVAKHDGFTGGLKWAITAGGVSTQYVTDSVVSQQGEIFVGGITFGNLLAGGKSYFQVGTSDSYVLQIDTSGAILSISGMGAPSANTQLTSMEMNLNGDLFVGGLFSSALQGQGPSGAWSISPSQGGNDLFVMKNPFSSLSGTSWASSAGTSSDDSVQSIAVSATGEVFIATLIGDPASSSATVITGGSQSATSSGYYDGVVAGLTSNGAWDWMTTTGGSDYELITSLAVNESDYITAAGGLIGTMTKDSLSYTSPSNNGWSAMVWSFDPAGMKDADSDSIPDISDNCPSVSNPTQANTDGDDKGDACDSDDDNDGITDNFPDLCPRGGQFNWTSMQDFSNPALSTDWDNDGCKDDAEDDDDDNDQVLDADDSCPYTSYSPPRPTWISDTATNDIDGDGCRDSDEDSNDDGDAFPDVSDECPTIFGNSTLGSVGCIDSDGDGWTDSYDDCPDQAGNSTMNDKNACPDNDGDGYSNDDDSFPDEPSQWTDLDGDGYGDNSMGTMADDCIDFAGTSSIDRRGCFDADEDGYSDADDTWSIEDGADSFPRNPTQWSDADEDGFGDNWGNSSWTLRNTLWPGEFVEGATQQDACPTQSGTSWQSEILGCPDSDGDGWYNLMDDLPLDSTQWVDVDGDGFGDNSSGQQPDACPITAGTSELDRFGCIDSDGDLYSNPDITWGPESGGDVFPNEITQWSDQDADGYGDNPLGVTPDACPTIRDSSTVDRYGCTDTDGDGISDPDEMWTLAMNADACPTVSGNSSMDRIGCFDGDGDGYSDPTESWSLDDGADAYPDDPLRWVKEPSSSSDGMSSMSGVFIGIGSIALIGLIAGIVLFLRKDDSSTVEGEKNWSESAFIPMGSMPPMPNMGAQPPVMIPDYSNSPAPVAGMQTYAQPVATPAVAVPDFNAQPVQTQPVVQPQAVVQPDPARDYYNGLLTQGYTPVDALRYTQQYYPTFQG